jgi:hypothetical protein
MPIVIASPKPDLEKRFARFQFAPADAQDAILAAPAELEERNTFLRGWRWPLGPFRALQEAL